MDCKIFIIEFYNKEGKTAPRDAHSREEEICRKRPAAGGESCFAGFYFIPARLSKLKHHIESLTCIKG